MNELEEAFDRGQKHYLPDIFVINQPNVGWLVQKAQAASLTRTQLPDRILLHRKEGFWAQAMQGESFPFNRFKEHQGIFFSILLGILNTGEVGQPNTILGNEILYLCLVGRDNIAVRRGDYI